MMLSALVPSSFALVQRWLRRTAVALCTLCAAASASAVTPAVLVLPESSPVPGGVVVLPLGIAADQPAPTAVSTSKGHPVLVAPGGAQGWVALVGIALAAKEGEDYVLVEQRDVKGARRVSFVIAPKQYTEQHVKVSPKMVDLNKADLQRHEAERAHQNQVMARFSPVSDYAFFMQQPTAGKLSDSFGKRRVFNGQARNPHSGLDISAPLGQTVVAPKAGVIADVGDYFFNGKTIWVDHGGGLMSMLCHLSRVDVRVGDVVQTGQAIAAVGSTGRSTGPHLHWSVMLNRAMVNPALFLR